MEQSFYSRTKLRLPPQSVSDGWRLIIKIFVIELHYENTPTQIYWKFYHPKNVNFQIKNSDIFHISAQNIDCGTR